MHQNQIITPGFVAPMSHLIVDQTSLGIDTRFTFSTDMFSKPVSDSNIHVTACTRTP